MKSLLITEQTVELVDATDEHAGQGDTAIEVSHSSLNYKDAMALRRDRGVVRTLPLVPGIDAVGTADGRLVTVNGAGLGERRHGGYTPLVRIDADHVVPVPSRFSAWHATAIGTAGFTAALSVREIVAHRALIDGPVLVTGASGGVGSIAVHLLASLGFEVHALTGRVAEQSGFLRDLGASEIVDRADFAEKGKPLQKARYAGVVDAVGSHTLVNALAQLTWGGVATACGLAQGPDLPGTVLPFILRGVRLIGINSVDAPHSLRVEAWDLLDEHLDTAVLEALTSTVSLDEVAAAGEELMQGLRRGRTVVSVAG